MAHRVKIPRFKDLPINRKILIIIMLVSVFALLLSWGSFVAYEIISYRGSVLNDLETLVDVTGYNCSAALIFDDQADAPGNCHSASCVSTRQRDAERRRGKIPGNDNYP